MLCFTACLGGFAGIVIWCFLRAVGLGSAFFWSFLPEKLTIPYLSVLICVAGGLLLGLTHRKHGVYPEELAVVMKKVKTEKYYEYRVLPALLLGTFLPLVLGASVGPEAGLTGIIAALCYWVGDNVTYAKRHAAEYSLVGEAVTLGQLFHSPLFGILAVEENGLEEDGEKTLLPKSSRLLYYGVSTAMSFLVISLMNRLFGAGMAGFPRFSEISISSADYLMMALYLPAGFLLYLWYVFGEKVSEKLASFIPGILREMMGGAVIGLCGLTVPLILFSGEEEMAELMDTFGEYAPCFLCGIGFLKILLTTFCIHSGWRGGHFFPLIFACTSTAFGLAMLVFPDPGGHVVFAAGIVTAVTLGAQLKKPLAVSALLLLCFPVRMLFWIFLAAVLGSRAVNIIRVID